MELLHRNVVKAVEYLIRVVQDEDVSHSDRIKAATFIVEKVYGKAPEHVRLDVGVGLPKWMQALTDGIVSTEEDIIEGEVIDVKEATPKTEEPTQSASGERERPKIRTRRDRSSITDRRLGRA